MIDMILLYLASLVLGAVFSAPDDASIPSSELALFSYTASGPSRTKTFITVTITPLDPPQAARAAWKPPIDCQILQFTYGFEGLLTEGLTETSSMTIPVDDIPYYQSFYYVFHCGPERSTCCPPDWQSDGYYTKYIPAGYEIVSPGKSAPTRVIRGTTETASVACPLMPSRPKICVDAPCNITKSADLATLEDPKFTKAPNPSVIYFQLSFNEIFSEVVGTYNPSYSASCIWQTKLPRSEATYSDVVAATSYTVLEDTDIVAYAPAIFVFGPTSNAELGEEAKKGLPISAIIGIAVGVGVPVVLGVGFFIWMLKRSRRPTVVKLGAKPKLCAGSNTKSASYPPAVSRFGVRPAAITRTPSEKLGRRTQEHSSKEEFEITKT